MRGKVLQQRDLFVGKWADLLAINNDRAQQYALLLQCHCKPSANTPEVDPLPCLWLIPVGVGLTTVGDMDDNLAPRQQLEGATATANWANRQSLQPLDRVRLAMSRHQMEILAIIGPKCTVRGIAQAHCLLDYRIEHGREVAGRGIDHLQDLGGRGLLLTRFDKLTFEIGYPLIGIG